VGRGTPVRIYLPASNGARPQEPAPDHGSGDNQLPQGDEVVLVVEDDARVRRVAVARLASMGYTVREAENGHRALGLLKENTDVALLFTDIVMPGGMTGDELAKEVRILRPDIAVLFTSGYSEPGLAGNDTVPGAQWLRKPYTAKELALRVRELLDAK
jgi:CheY-like chemotaxis protein